MFVLLNEIVMGPVLEATKEMPKNMVSCFIKVHISEDVLVEENKIKYSCSNKMCNKSHWKEWWCPATGIISVYNIVINSQCRLTPRCSLFPQSLKKTTADKYNRGYINLSLFLIQRHLRKINIFYSKK